MDETAADGFFYCTRCRRLLPKSEFIKDSRRKYGIRNECRDCRHKAYESRREEKLEQMRTYYLEHRDEIREKQSAKHWTETARQLKRVRDQRRRHDRMKATRDMTLPEWNAALDYFGNRCAYCGSDEDLTMDHVVPLSKGGGLTRSNIVPCCKSCNSSKCNTDMEVWYRTKPFFSEDRLRKIETFLRS